MFELTIAHNGSKKCKLCGHPAYLNLKLIGTYDWKIKNYTKKHIKGSLIEYCLAMCKRCSDGFEEMVVGLLPFYEDGGIR